MAESVRLTGHASIHQAAAETFLKAGVDTGVKAGTRLLRHSAASRLLRATDAFVSRRWWQHTPRPATYAGPMVGMGRESAGRGEGVKLPPHPIFVAITNYRHEPDPGLLNQIVLDAFEIVADRELASEVIRSLLDVATFQEDVSALWVAFAIAADGTGLLADYASVVESAQILDQKTAATDHNSWMARFTRVAASQEIFELVGDREGGRRLKEGFAELFPIPESIALDFRARCYYRNGRFLRHYAELVQDDSLLDLSIASLTDALNVCPLSQFSSTATRSNLAFTYWAKYSLTGEVGDLDQALHALNCALASTDTSDRGLGRLHNLHQFLSIRAGEFGIDWKQLSYFANLESSARFWGIQAQIADAALTLVIETLNRGRASRIAVVSCVVLCERALNYLDHAEFGTEPFGDSQIAHTATALRVLVDALHAAPPETESLRGLVRAMKGALIKIANLDESVDPRHHELINVRFMYDQSLASYLAWRTGTSL